MKNQNLSEYYIRFGYFVALFFAMGCASHLKSHAPVNVPVVVAPVKSKAVPVVDNSATETAALHKAYVVAPVVSTVAAPVVSTVAAPVVSTVAAPVVSTVVTEGKKQLGKIKPVIFFLSFGLLGFGAYASRKYWLPFVKKALAWIKSRNILAKLKTLETEAAAKVKADVVKIETDIKKL
jgi:hypothetical protein